MSRSPASRRAGLASSVVVISAVVLLSGCGLRAGRTTPASAGSTAPGPSVQVSAPASVEPSSLGQPSGAQAGEAGSAGSAGLAQAEQIVTEADALLARAEAEAAGDQ